MMDSDDEYQLHRHDSDSDDDLGAQSDDSWSSFVDDDGHDSHRSRSRSNSSDDDEDTVPTASTSSGGRGGRKRRGSGRDQPQEWKWTLMQEEETGNPAEWLIQFNDNNAGINNVQEDIPDRDITRPRSSAYFRLPQTHRRSLTKCRQITRPPPTEPRIGAAHYPSKYEDEHYRPDFKVCTKVKVRTQTRFYCKECGLALCLYPCFTIYHTNENIVEARQRAEETGDVVRKKPRKK